MFYLWLGRWPESLAYGCMLGVGVAAIGFEFFKFIHWHRADRKEGSAARAAWDLARGAFRVGFVKTFSEVMRETAKEQAELQATVSIVIAVKP